MDETIIPEIANQEYEKNDSVNSFSKIGSNIMENYLDTIAQKDIPTPLNATPKLKSFMSQSPVHFSATQEDVNNYSDIERFAHKMHPATIYGKQINSTNLNKSAYNLMLYDNGMVDDSTIKNENDRANELVKVKEYKDMLDVLSQYDKPDDFWIDTIPGVASLGVQIIDAIENNKTLALKSAVIGGMAGPLGSVGLTLATTGALDNFQVTAGEIYRETYLEQPDEVKSRINREDAKNIAIGAATLSATIEFGTSAALAKTTGSSFTKAMKAKAIAEIAKREGLNSTLMQTLAKVGKVVVTQMAEQGAPEYLQQVTSDLAKVGINPDQEIDGENVVKALTSKEAFLSAIIGTVAGIGSDVGPQAITTSVGIIKQIHADERGSIEIPKKDKVTVDKPNEPVKSTNEILLNQKIQGMKRELEQSKKLVTQINEIRKKVSIDGTDADSEVLSNITDGQFYVSKDAIERMETNQKGFIEAFERFTKNKITDDQEVYSFTAKQYIDLVKFDDTFPNNVSLEPSGPNLKDFDVFEKQLEQNKEIIFSLLDELKVENITQEQQFVIYDQINKIVNSSWDGIYNVPTNVNRPIIDSKVTPMVAKNNLEQMIEAIKSAREESAKAIKEKVLVQDQKAISLDVQVEMEDNVKLIEDAIVKNSQFNTERFYQNEIEPDDKLLNVFRQDPEFKNKSNEQIMVQLQNNHRVKTLRNPFAFDPSTLPSEFENLHKDRRVKDKGAFVKGGLDFNKWGGVIAQSLLGENATPRDLLIDLKGIETRDEFRSRRIDEDLKAQYEISKQDFAPNKYEFEKAFDKVKTMSLEFSKLADEHKGALKTLIKTLAKNFKPTKQLQTEATFLTYALKTKDLDPRLYEANQKRFLLKAAEALNKGDWVEFFRNKEKEALNILVKENVKDVKNQIEKRAKWVKSLSTKDAMRVLYKAGQEYVDAFETLKEAFNGKPFVTSKLQEIAEMMKPYIAMGVGLPVEFEKMVQKKDVKVQQGDLNASEVIAILDSMIAIHAIAKAEVNLDYAGEKLSILAMQREIVNDLRPRSNFNIERVNEYKQIDNEKRSVLREKYETAIEILTSYFSAIRNLSTTVVNGLDNGITNGRYYNLIIKPFLDAIKIESDLRAIHTEFERKNALEIFGKQKYEELTGDTTYIPELSLRFKNGMVSYWNIIEMLGLYGSESGRVRLLKDLQISEEKLLKIFKNNVDDKMIRYVQAMHNFYEKTMYQERVERQARLGVPPSRKVLGLGYEINGIQTNGGYWPIRSEKNLLDQATESMTGWVDAFKKGQVGTKMTMFNLNTFDGHEMERMQTASSPLVYDYASWKQSINTWAHHAAFAEPSMKVSKVLGNQEIAESIVGIVGMKNFANMLSILQYASTGANDYDLQFQAAINGSSIFKEFINKRLQNLYVYHLGFGVKTFAKQTLSLPVMVDRLSQSIDGGLMAGNYEALKHIMEPGLKMWHNPREFGRVVQEIAKYDVQFKNYVDKLSKNRAFSWLFKFDQAVDMYAQGESELGRMIDAFKDGSLEHLTLMQLYVNTAMYLGSYNAALAGKVKNIKAGDIKAAHEFAGFLVRDTLSDDSALGQSSIQQTDIGKILFFAQNQQNLVTDQFIGAANRMSTEISDISGPAQTAKGTLGAMQTMIAASVGPAAMSVITAALFRKLVPDDRKKDEPEKDTWQTILSFIEDVGIESLSILPPLRQLAFGMRAVDDFNVQPQDINFANPVIGLGDDLKRFITALWAARSADVDMSRQDWRFGMDFVAKSIGVPKVNMIPTPLDPKGMALQTQMLNKLLDQTDLKNEYPRYRQTIPTNKGSEGINLLMEMNGEPAPSPTPTESKENLRVESFNNAVEKLNQPGIDEKKRQIYAIQRDLFYSPNGVTNPEGDIIQAKSGELDVSDYKVREKLTFFLETISRLETLNHTDFKSDSGAEGYFHFTKGTWNDLSQDYPELELPETAGKASKALQYRAYWKFMGDNINSLNRLKQDVNLENLFMIHMLGRGGYKTFIDADPNQDLSNILPVAFKWNKGVMEGKTRNKILEGLRTKMVDYMVEADNFLKSEKLLTSKP
jgi:hypothetical protein